MLEEATKPEMNPSNSKKKRLKEYRRMEARVQSALEQGRIEEDLKDVRMERVVSLATKQAMIARVSLLPLLCLDQTYVFNPPLAPTRTRPPHQPLYLWSLCHKKHYPSYLPRSLGHNTIHDLGQPLPQTQHIYIHPSTQEHDSPL
jgi:hypothetical protein